MPLDPTLNRPMTARREPVLTVGQNEGDLRGADDKILQAGVEYLHRLGGGVLRILPGEYLMHNALYLRPNLTVCGSGPDTVLKKAPSVVTPLLQDADWFEAAVRVAHPDGFAVGGGILLRAYYDGGAYPMIVVKDTITAMDGDVLFLSRRLEQNMWPGHRATASTLFPLITGEYVHGVTVENLTLDGDRAHNEELNGNYVGGVFIQHCDRWTFRNVTARNYSGDGFSFQVCDDIHFEDCTSENNGLLGFHPGSGSQRPVFRRCVSRGNDQGIFFCWGVSDGLVEACICSDNRDYGITIGHRDTDARIVGCTIERNAKVGILFREEERAFLAGHRTLIASSVIRDNGFEADGVGIEIRGEVYDTAMRNNRLEDAGHSRQKIGVRIGPAAQRVELADNTFTGLEVSVQDLRRERSSG
jgi:hypothetical protein